LELPREVTAKLFRSGRSVQLIVFFAAIREILKKEIYGGDKPDFSLLKTKGWRRAQWEVGDGL